MYGTGAFLPQGGGEMLERLANALWGWHTLALILAAGLWFSLCTRFFQVRHVPLWMKAALGTPGEKQARGGMSPFRALATALAGSLGTGNILGVGVAIAVGGPGALFWMWASALLGMMTVFAENLLAARHRQAPGALGYLEKAGKPLALVYAAGCCLASLGMGNLVQAHAAAAAWEAIGLPPLAVGATLGAVAFCVARGGLGLAGRIAEKLVPAMALVFFAGAWGVLWVFRAELPRAVASIFQGAFSLKAGAGGTVGMLLALGAGVSRGVFSNEAGLGSSAFAYGAVRGRTPVELGCLGIFQVFADTILMCTVTGLCILCCPTASGEGAGLVFTAFASALGPAGAGVAALCTALFALATVVAWCGYGREGLFYLTGGRGRDAFALAAAGAAVLGSLLPLGAVVALGDAMNGLLALPNLAALFLLSREVAEEMERGERALPRRGNGPWKKLLESLHNFLKRA